MVVLLAAICVIPFVLMASASVTSELALNSSGYKFWPKEFSLNAYRYLWQKHDMLFRCYGITLVVTVVGTLLNVSITSLMAYPLSRKNFKLRNVFTFLVFFTMIFNGGTTAWYIVWSRYIKVKNTVFAYLLPNLLMSAFNVLLMKNYFSTSIPEAIVEAAKIDGASEWKVFCQIIMPLSTPVTATVALFSAIAYWNDWINGMYFISKPEMYNINVYIDYAADDSGFVCDPGDWTGRSAASHSGIVSGCCREKSKWRCNQYLLSRRRHWSRHRPNRRRLCYFCHCGNTGIHGLVRGVRSTAAACGHIFLSCRFSSCCQSTFTIIRMHQEVGNIGNLFAVRIPAALLPEGDFNLLPGVFTADAELGRLPNHGALLSRQSPATRCPWYSRRFGNCPERRSA